MKNKYALVLLLTWVFHLDGHGKGHYSDTIQPILSENCFHCHGPDSNDRKAGLRLDEKTGKFQPDEILRRIFSKDPEERMPPPKSKLTLKESEKVALQKWIQAGADYEEHWSFVAPVRPKVPEVGQGHPIDAFLLSKLQENSLFFSQEAAPQKLIRRVTLDLTGLPPTPEETENFVRSYAKSPEKTWAATIDRLLASPRYGEHMALAWLDAARYADTDGYQFDGPRFMWRWRDWVIHAYNSNKPFDEFTIEQIAGDLIPNASLDQRLATGFNRNHRYNSEEGLVVEEFLLENAVDRVDTTSTLWMGLTIGCARCHDHKYDPISQKDYYQLIAFFNSVPEAGRALKQHNSEPIMLAPTKDQFPEWQKKKEEVQLLKASLKPGDTPQNGGLLINRKIANHFPLKDKAPEKSKANGKPLFGKEGLQLDGKSSVEIRGLAKEVSFKANSRFSIAFWIKPENLADSVLVARQQKSISRPGVEIAMVENGKVRFDLLSRWISGTGRAISKAPLQEGQWTHLAFTNDASQSANGQKIFINGKEVETTVTYNTNSNVGGVGEKEPLRIGHGVRPDAKHFKGTLRDIRLYSTNLWPEEVNILAAKYGGVKRKEFSRVKMTPTYGKYVKAREDLEAYEAKLPTAMVMEDSKQPKVTHIRNRGVYDDYGEIVGRDVPHKLPPMAPGLSKDRLGFAQWLLSDEHPLTARVAVNRYWQKYFGTGLVKTAEDFGVQGERPSHPELLDWLAVEFRESGWDVAKMQKLILTSKAYKQQSNVNSKLLEIDPHNRLISRGPRQRLTGHAIRDQALFVSGLLKERIGGPSVSPYQPANLWAEMSMGMKYKQSKGEDLYRRSLYTIWKRTVAPPAMAIFDAADREACWVSSKETNTPLQALTLLNETGFVEAARHLAGKVIQEPAPERIHHAFQTVLARSPSSAEEALFQEALAAYQAEYEQDVKSAKSLLSTGASPPHHKGNLAELAAWTTLSNILLNLDETITRE